MSVKLIAEMLKCVTASDAAINGYLFCIIQLVIKTKTLLIPNKIGN